MASAAARTWGQQAHRLDEVDAPDGGDDGATAVAHRILMRRLGGAVTGLGPRAAAVRERDADPNALVDLAERYAWVHAAAACPHLWWHNRDRPLYGAGPGATGWLRATLACLLARAEGVDPRRYGPDLLPALDTTPALGRSGRLMTAMPARLASASHPMEDS